MQLLYGAGFGGQAARSMSGEIRVIPPGGVGERGVHANTCGWEKPHAVVQGMRSPMSMQSHIRSAADLV